MVQRVLRREAFEVDCARDGFEAIEKISKNDYSTILLDLMMPRVDGVGVLRYLENSDPALAPSVILMTAAADSATEAAQAGPVVALLRKPFDISELVAHVRQSENLETAPLA